MKQTDMFGCAKIIWLIKAIVLGALGFYRLEVDGLENIDKIKGKVALFENSQQDSTKVELEFSNGKAFITQKDNGKPVSFSLFNKILKTNLDEDTDLLCLFLHQNNGKVATYFKLSYTFERNNIQPCMIDGLNDFEMKSKIRLGDNYTIRMSTDKVKCAAILRKHHGKTYLANLHNNKLTQFDLFDTPLYISNDSFLEFKKDGDRIILSFKL